MTDNLRERLQTVEAAVRSISSRCFYIAEQLSFVMGETDVVKELLQMASLAKTVSLNVENIAADEWKAWMDEHNAQQKLFHQSMANLIRTVADGETDVVRAIGLAEIQKSRILSGEQ
jgi:hypothetical protein